MATAPVTSPLHNFPLSFLKWGSTTSVNPHHRCRRPDAHKSHHPHPPPDSDPPSADDHAQRQWNLRPRRPPSEIACFIHANTAEVQTDFDSAPRSSRLRGDSAAAERREKQKLWLALSKDEIDDDIYALTGAKPSRRPRKRPKSVQKQIDTLFPGQWLVGMSPEAYRCLDAPSKR